MRQDKKKLFILTDGLRLLNITDHINRFVNSSNINDGLLNISILHTSASLLIQENADLNVQNDIYNYVGKMIHNCRLKKINKTDILTAGHGQLKYMRL